MKVADYDTWLISGAEQLPKRRQPLGSQLCWPTDRQECLWPTFRTLMGQLWSHEECDPGWRSVRRKGDRRPPREHSVTL